MGQKVFGGTFWVLPFLSLLSLWKLGLVPLPLMTVIRQADSPLYSASNPKGPHKHLSCHPPYSIPGHRIKKQHLKTYSQALPATSGLHSPHAHGACSQLPSRQL